MKDVGAKSLKKPPIWRPLLTREAPLMAVVEIMKANHYLVREMLRIDFNFNNIKHIKDTYFMDLNELREFGTLMRKEIRINPGYLINSIEWCKRQGEKLLEVSSQIYQLKDISKLSNNQLREWYKRYLEELRRYFTFLPAWAVIMRIFEETIATKLKEIVEKEGGKEPVDAYLKDLIIPSRDNLVVEEVRDLMEICAKIQANPEIQKMFVEKDSKEILKELREKESVLFSHLENHVKKFSFLDMYWFKSRPMTMEALVVRTKDLLKSNCSQRLQEMIEGKEEREKKYKSIIERFGISGELLSLIECAREHAYFRLHRMDLLFQAGYYVRGLLEEIGGRMGISYDEVLHLTSEEIINFLEEGILPDFHRVEMIKKFGFGLLLENDEVKIITGEQLKSFIEEEKVKEEREIKGTVASTGKHVGEAKIVTSIFELDKVKDNDVLVTIMTEPAYLPALIRCGAVVTEEGGLLSHAAIVSRELRKPCIIGTKIATKIFKDRDLLEVDATGKQGIVRMLKSTKRGEIGNE